MKKNNISQELKFELGKNRREDVDLNGIVGLFFCNDDEIKNFIDRSLSKRNTRLMLNRIESFVCLADSQIYDSAKVFFLIAMAEANIKLLENRFEQNLNQTEDVKKFFSRFSKQDKEDLSKYFFTTGKFLDKRNFTLTKVVNILLNVRHAVVHGKNHYAFRFYNKTKGASINIIFGEIGSQKSKKKIQYELKITYDKFKKIMVGNAIKNIESCSY